MQNRPPEQKSISLILHGSVDAARAARIIEEAESLFTPLAAEFEILLPLDLSDLPTPSGRVRVIRVAGTDSLAGALRASAGVARGELLVLSDANLDVSELTYLLPLAEQHAIIWDNSLRSSGSVLTRVTAWGYNWLGRILLKTPLRNSTGMGVLALVQRSALAECLPESSGLFGSAEMLGKARQRGLSIAEIDSGHALAPITHSAPRWRDLVSASVSMLHFWWSKIQFPASPPTRLAHATWGWGLLLAVIAGLLLFTDLNHPLLDPDEGRQAEIPREMLEHNDLLLPRMLGEPYYDKPPLQYWLTAAAYTAFGLRPWVARLVPALAAWLTLLLAFGWAQRSLGVRAAFLGGLGLCLTPGFVILGRTVILDSLLTACVAAGWYTAHTAVAGSSLRWRWWTASAVICGLGILAKGPVALVLVLPPVVAYQFLTPAVTRLRWLPLCLYAGIAVSVAAPWYIAMAVREANFVEQFLWKANVLRFVSPYDHQHGWFYYVPVLFGITFPWSLFWPALGYFLLSRTRQLAALRNHGLGFCALSMVWCLLFYSLSGCKSPPYVAPILIPLALLQGAFVDRLLFDAVKVPGAIWEFARQQLPRRLALFMLVMSAGCALITGVLGWQGWGSVLVQLFIALLATGVWWHFGRHAVPIAAWSACALATLTFNLFALQDLVSGLATRHSPRAAARLALHQPGSASIPVVAYGRQWPSASFYLRRDFVPFTVETECQSLMNVAKTTPAMMILVESGPRLRELKAALPDCLQAEVLRPKYEGHVVTLVLRQKKLLVPAPHP